MNPQTEKLLLQLGRAALRQIRSTPDRLDKKRPKAPKVLYKTRQTHLQHDPLLEAYANQLLRTLKTRLRVRIFWNPKLRTTAGLAYPDKNIAVLNPKLLQYPSSQMHRILRHEVAHLLAFHRHGSHSIQNHGPEWKQACKDLGIPDESLYHTLFKPKRLKPNLIYICPHCQTTIKRVRPFRRESACIRCCKKFHQGTYSKTFKLKILKAA
jgi:predicted SprT family Zn-dependent metalloprotease